MKLDVPYSKALPQLLSIAKAHGLKLHKAAEFHVAVSILKSRIKLN